METVAAPFGGYFRRRAKSDRVIFLEDYYDTAAFTAARKYI
jgi:hypothetical protein